MGTYHSVEHHGVNQTSVSFYSYIINRPWLQAQSSNCNKTFDFSKFSNRQLRVQTKLAKTSLIS